MPKAITDEIRAELKNGYRSVLNEVVFRADLLMQYAAMRGWTLEEAYVAIDARIRQLDAELKA